MHSSSISLRLPKDPQARTACAGLFSALASAVNCPPQRRDADSEEKIDSVPLAHSSDQAEPLLHQMLKTAKALWQAFAVTGKHCPEAQQAQTVIVISIEAWPQGQVV